MRSLPMEHNVFTYFFLLFHHKFTPSPDLQAAQLRVLYRIRTHSSARTFLQFLQRQVPKGLLH